MDGSGREEARRAAAELGVPLEVADIRQHLYQQVVQPFVQGYLQGITPIPCVMCNPAVKFRFLLDYADQIGASHVATGHYARLRQMEAGYTGLFASPAPNDQSYMLYRLGQQQLSRLVFPLGKLAGKEYTRALALQNRLSVAQKPDSMEICFIPDGDYAKFICQQAGQKTPPPGDFVDEAGHVLGRHLGIHHYTVGQRRGLDISAASRLFVKAIDPATNRVVLSDQWPQASTVFVHSLCRTAPDYGDIPFEAAVKIRHSRRQGGYPDVGKVKKNHTHHPILFVKADLKIHLSRRISKHPLPRSYPAEHHAAQPDIRIVFYHCMGSHSNISA